VGPTTAEAGITIVSGTDALAGYQWHHELELCVRAGIPATDVLRLATLTSARNMRAPAAVASSPMACSPT
jgi:imidazolonepropionase-like amidohydrolase